MSDEMDGKTKMLTEIAESAEEVVKHHDGHGCGNEHFGRVVSRALRTVLNHEEGAVVGRGHSGPAQVATPVYRANYDSIFGVKMTAGQA
jgi:hypothetical protein